MFFDICGTAYCIPAATHNAMGPVATTASSDGAAMMQDFLSQETFDFERRQQSKEGDLMIHDREAIQSGHIQLSEKPGLGIDIEQPSHEASDGWPDG